MIHSYSFHIDTACKLLGFSRQAYYKGLLDKPELEEDVIRLIASNLRKARKACPSQGCRSMYDTFGDQLPIGRDKSIALFMELGYRVKYPKRYGRATQSGTREFPNLLVNKQVDGINQVWQGDMAHYLYGDSKLYTIYLTECTVRRLLVMKLMTRIRPISMKKLCTWPLKERSLKGTKSQE